MDAMKERRPPEDWFQQNVIRDYHYEIITSWLRNMNDESPLMTHDHFVL